MSNVVPLRTRAAEAKAREAEALAEDLAGVIARLLEASERGAALARPTLEVERTVQLLLDAVTAVEQAIDVVTVGGGPPRA